MTDWFAVLLFAVVIALGTARIWLGYFFIFARMRRHRRPGG